MSEILRYRDELQEVIPAFYWFPTLLFQEEFQGNDVFHVEVILRMEDEFQQNVIERVVDTVPPTGTIIINNGAAYTKTRNVILNLTALDIFTGVRWVEISNYSDFSIKERRAWVGDGNYSWELSLGDGTKTVYVRYGDYEETPEIPDGNWSIDYSDTIILDTTPPTIIDNQIGDDVWRNAGGTTYDVDFRDDGSLLSHIQYTIWTEKGRKGTQLKGWTNIATNINAQNYTTNWQIDFGACREGINYVSVRAYDNAGNFSILEDAFYVKKDTQLPNVCVITDPINGSRVSGEKMVKISASDVGSGIKKVVLEYRKEIGSWLRIGEGINEVKWDTTKLKDGWYHLRAIAYDYLDHFTYSGVIQVLVKNEPLDKMTIISPTWGQRFDTYNIDFIAIVPGADLQDNLHFEIEIDNDPDFSSKVVLSASNIEPSKWEYTIDNFEWKEMPPNGIPPNNTGSIFYRVKFKLRQEIDRNIYYWRIRAKQ